MDIDKIIKDFVDTIPYIDTNTLKNLVKRIKINLIIRDDSDPFVKLICPCCNKPLDYHPKFCKYFYDI
jgi:hypothetical protein